MNGNQFKLLIDEVLSALANASCEEWNLLRFDGVNASIKNVSVEMNIRLFTISDKTKFKFTGIYTFPGSYSTEIQNRGPRQTMRVDHASPSLVAFKILTRFCPAYYAYVRNDVAAYRRMLQNDYEIAHEIAAQIELATGRKLRVNDNIISTWSPDGPLSLAFEGKNNDTAVVRMKFDRSLCENPDEMLGRFTYSFSSSNPGLANAVEEVLLGYPSAIVPS